MQRAHAKWSLTFGELMRPHWSPDVCGQQNWLAVEMRACWLSKRLSNFVVRCCLACGNEYADLPFGASLSGNSLEMALLLLFAI